MAVVTGAVVGAATIANSAYQGHKARSAARDAASTQAAAADRAAGMTQAAQEQLRSDLSPYRQVGETALPLLQSLASAPQIDRVAQLQSNPLFQASLASRDRATLGAAANQGRIGTGEFSQQIAENYLLSASPLINQQMEEERIREQRLLNLANIGQSSASQTGVSGLQAAQASGANLMAGANAQSAGIVAGQQAMANRNAEILQNLPTLIGAFRG